MKSGMLIKYHIKPIRYKMQTTNDHSSPFIRLSSRKNRILIYMCNGLCLSQKLAPVKNHYQRQLVRRSTKYQGKLADNIR